MDEHGYCCVSCDLQWEMESFYSADKIIFEVNPRIPHLPGDCALPVAMADVIIESDLTLYELQDPPIGEAEKAVAQYAAEMVHDGDCIQLGFGGIPNAIGFELMNRHDLGIHTEQIGRLHGSHESRAASSPTAIRTWTEVGPSVPSSSLTTSPITM